MKMRKRPRKVLQNNFKSKRFSGYKEGRIGLQLPIRDKNNNVLAVGDTIRYGEYYGVLLFEPDSREYCIALGYSMWYGDNPYDTESYGKFIDIPMDNGARMELEKCTCVANDM